jgi:hypothetical protein
MGSLRGWRYRFDRRLIGFLQPPGDRCVPSSASAGSRTTGHAAVDKEFRRGPGPGYVKDHVVPLACGGPDSVGNLQRQTTAAAKAKDRWERKGCR